MQPDKEHNSKLASEESMQAERAFFSKLMAELSTFMSGHERTGPDGMEYVRQSDIYRASSAIGNLLAIVLANVDDEDLDMFIGNLREMRLKRIKENIRDGMSVRVTNAFMDKVM